MTTTREEVREAKAAFGQWFPRHGALQTRKNNLYVALHQALERGDVDRRQLVRLGDKLKKALGEKPREEIKALVEKAEAIHNKDGLEAGLAYLHGELTLVPEEEKKPKPPTGSKGKAARPGSAMMQALETTKFAGRPSEKLAELERVLGRNQPKALTHGLTALLTRRQDNLLRTARKIGKVKAMARAISALSEKTNVPIDEVKAKLLEVLDKVHEIDEDQPPHVNSIFAKLAETGSIQNRYQLARVLKLFRNTTNRLNRKMTDIKARTGATETPTVFAEVLALINEASEKEGKTIPLGNLATIIAAKVKRYEINAGVDLEEIEELDLEPDGDTA